MRRDERKVIVAFDYSHIGERIRYYRTKAGMSQGDLASALFISSNQYISRLENGKVAPSLEIIISMAQVFHIRTDDLLLSSEYTFEEADSLADCPAEIKPVLLKITAAINEILTESYRR